MSVSLLRSPARATPVAGRAPSRLARLGRFLTTPGSGPRWGEVLAFALLAALVIVVAYWEVVFGGRSLSLGATWTGVLPTGPYGYPVPRVAIQITDPLGFYIREPWRLLAAHLWTQGQVPLWDPYLGGGSPLDPFSQSDAFFLPEMIFAALPFPWWDAYYLLRLVCCGVFAYIFLRSLKLSPLAAATGAVAYMLSGCLTWVVSTDMLDGFMLTPLLLWSIERLVTSHRHRLRWSVVVVLFTWQLLLSGFPESFLLALVLAALYFFTRALQERLRAAGPMLASWRAGLLVALGTLPAILARYALIALAAAALALPALLLFLDITRTSGGLQTSAVRVNGSPALRYDFRLFFPLFYGTRVAQWNLAIPGAGDSQFFFGYTGLVAGCLAVVAVVAVVAALVRRRRPALWLHALFFAAVAFVVMARVNDLPVVGFISDLPGLRTIKFFRYAGGIWAICLAVLAAIGADALLARRGWLRLASVAIFLALVGALLLPNLNELQTALRGMDTVHQRTALAAATTSLLAGGIVLVGLVAALALGAYIPRAAQVGLFALLLVELLADVPTVLPRSYNTYTPPPYLAYVQRAQNSDQPVRTFGLNGVAYPNTEDGLDLQDARNFNALPVNVYRKLVVGGFDSRAFDMHGFTGQDFPLPPGTMTEAQAAVQNRWVLDLLNVRYVLTDATDLGATHTLIRAIHSPFDLTTTPPLRQDAPLDQTFIMPAANLSAVLLSFTGRLEPADAGTLTLHVRLASAPGADVRSATLPLSQVQTTGTTRFAFDPLPDSAHQAYFLVLSTKHMAPATHLALWAVSSTNGHPVSGLDQAGTSIPRMALTLAVETGTPTPSDYHLAYNQDVRIYENPDALPRAFAAGQVQTDVSDDQALAQLGSPGFPLASTLLLAGTPPADEVAPATGDTSGADFGSTVRVTGYQADTVTLQANMTHAGFVALQDTYYPGWHASVDGVETPIYRSDIMFRAVFVPAGTHTIRFTYWPNALAIGLLFVPLPPLLLLGWLALAAIMRRVRPRQGKTAIRTGAAAARMVSMGRL